MALFGLLVSLRMRFRSARVWGEKASGFDRSNPMGTILIAPLMMLATEVTAVG